MKRKNLLLIVLMITVMIISGCSTSQSKPEPEANTVTGKITGGFTATVRELLPDYVSDDKTNTMAVVTEFQAPPFIVNVGEDIASKLEKGKNYYFQVKERFVVDIPEKEFKEGELDTLEAVNKYNLEISEFREPTEEEKGNNSPKIIIEKSK